MLLQQVLRKGPVMKIQEESGFTLLEIIMAISVLTIGLLAVASMQATALKGDRFAYSRTEGATLAQDKLEEFIALPFTDPRLADGYTETDTSGQYTVSVSVANGTINNTRIINITTIYQGNPLNQVSYVRSSLLE